MLDSIDLERFDRAMDVVDARYVVFATKRTRRARCVGLGPSSVPLMPIQRPEDLVTGALHVSQTQPRRSQAHPLRYCNILAQAVSQTTTIMLRRRILLFSNKPTRMVESSGTLTGPTTASRDQLKSQTPQSAFLPLTRSTTYHALSQIHCNLFRKHY